MRERGAGSLIAESESELPRETDTLYFSLLENLPHSVFRKDTQGRFVFANSKFCAMINRQKIEIIGKTDAELFPINLAAKYRADDLEVLASRTVLDTFEQHQAGGGMLHVRVIKTPIFNARGEVTGIQGVFWDETERHKAQVALAKARDAALESARLKSEFLANMSHEIRTPMNAIIGMTGLLLDANLSVEQRDFADTIRVSADSLLKIINDILDFSKIEAGKLAVEKIDFDLSEIVERANDLVRESARAKRIALKTRIHEDVPRRLCGDPGRLRQVLTNLLGNAVKFTEQGEVTLDVTRAEISADEIKIHFAVRDTGVGVPPEAQGRIFEAFTQGDGSVTRRYGGTGLGLAICKQLVELMQGRIGFSSEQEKGSTFWFELPFAPAMQTQSLSTTAPRKQPAPARQTKNSVRLLLAEDNAVNQKVALRQLSKLGYRVHAVNNGLQAVQALENEFFPIVLMDCQMPEMDGYKATECIRLMQDTTPVRWDHRPYIIAMTANALAGDREACLAAGMDDYVSKPVRLEDLDSALQRGLDAMLQKYPAPQAASNGHTKDQLIDSEALDNLRALRMDGEPDPLAELVELFIADTPGKITQLYAAVKNSAAHDLEAAAHSLKGSAGNLGAATISASCMRLMQLAKTSDFAAAGPFVKAIEDDFTKVKFLLLEESKR